MTQTIETLFDQAIERYKAGEGPEDLIPVFKDICDRAPKSSAAWACLAWLYLLDDKPNSGLKAAQKAVKITPQDPQARVNLALACLEAGKTGVRDHIEVASQVMNVSEELHTEVMQNIEEGLTRKPDWKSLQRIQKWLTE